MFLRSLENSHPDPSAKRGNSHRVHQALAAATMVVILAACGSTQAEYSAETKKEAQADVAEHKNIDYINQQAKSGNFKPLDRWVGVTQATAQRPIKPIGGDYDTAQALTDRVNTDAGNIVNEKCLAASLSDLAGIESKASVIKSPEIRLQVDASIESALADTAMTLAVRDHDYPNANRAFQLVHSQGPKAIADQVVGESATEWKLWNNYNDESFGAELFVHEVPLPNPGHGISYLLETDVNGRTGTKNRPLPSSQIANQWYTDISRAVEQQVKFEALPIPDFTPHTTAYEEYFRNLPKI